MSRALLLSPSIPLVQEVLGCLLADGNDYSRNIVVFPGKRPAHFLRKALAERHGHALIPPRIFAMEGFVDFLCGKLPDALPAPITAADAADLLFDLQRTLPDRIGGTQFSQPDTFMPLGMRIFGELEELALSGHTPERITGELSGIALRGLHSLGALYSIFYAALAERKLTTRSLRYRAVAEAFREEMLAPASTLVLAGFFSLTGVEQRLVGQLLDLPDTVALFQEGPGMEQRLKELGVAVSRKGEAPEGPLMSYHAAPDTHGEIFALAGHFQKVMEEEGSIDHRTVVVVPDPSAIPALVHHALAMLPGTYNISIGYPYKRTPVVGFLWALMELIEARYDEKFPASEYLRLALHPYIKNILFKGNPHGTRVLFHAIEDLCLKGTIPAFFTLQELEERTDCFEQAARMAGDAEPRELVLHLRGIHENIIEPLTTAVSVGDCAERAGTILSFIAEHSTARRHLFFGPYVEAVMETLHSLSRSLVAGRTFDASERMFSILRTCLSEGSVPLPGTPLGGVQVLGILETRNLHFDSVLVLNTNDELIPGEGGRYSLVPDGVRTALGMPTYRERDRIVEYYFSVLLGGASRVALFYTEDGSATPSRFLEQALWRRQKQEGVSSGTSMVRDVRYKVTLQHDRPSPVMKTDGVASVIKNMTLSATSLDTYLKCGLKFYYRYVLRMEEREELAGDVDRAELGSLVHRVLAEYYRPFVGQTLVPETLDSSRIRPLVDSLFRETFGAEELGNRFLMKTQITRHLMDFVNDYEIPRVRTTPVELLAVEQDIHSDLNGYRFRGRLDRVERSGDRVTIFDYKTGSDKRKLTTRMDRLEPEVRESWAEAIGSLQLPLYALLYARESAVPLNSIVSQYLLLGKNSLDPGIEIPHTQADGSPGGASPVLEKVISILLDELGDEREPFQPTQDLEANCPYCPFTGLCGTRWVRRMDYA